MLKAIDRRVFIGFGIGIAAIVLLFVSFVRPAMSGNDAAKVEQKRIETEVASLRERISEIQQNGTSSISALIAKVRSIEIALPRTVDDLSLASSLSTAARTANVELIEFDLTSDEPEKQGALEYLEYSMAVRGSTSGALDWLASVQKSTEFVITFTDLNMTADRSNDGSGAATTADQDAIGDRIVLDGVLRVWMLQGDRVVATDQNPSNASGAVTPAAEPTPAGSTNP